MPSDWDGRDDKDVVELIKIMKFTTITSKCIEVG